MNNSKLKCEEIKTAREFLDRFRLSRDDWGHQRGYTGWLFRGQSNSDWKLTPKAWRPGDALDKVKNEARENIINHVREIHRSYRWTDYDENRLFEHHVQIAAEAEAVWQFSMFCNRIGKPLDEAELLFGGCKTVESIIRNKPLALRDPKKFFDNLAFATAQHHGIPTRLMDWTWRPLVAAFFAAEGIDRSRLEAKKKREREPTHLAVFAWSFMPGPFPSTFRLVTPPTPLGSFLYAQKAAFVAYRDGDDHFLKHGFWPAFEDVLASEYLNDDKVFRKITLPVSEAPGLLELLRTEDISRETLMPTYDNVAQHLLNTWDHYEIWRRQKCSTTA